MNIRNVELSKEKYSIKCPYEMKAEFIVVHNTYNDASASNEIAYMQRNNNQVSFHFAVDDKEAVQGLPLNRNGWHSGDGATGNGNRCGIAVEICYSKSGGAKFEKAEINATKLIAQLLKERKWGVSRVKKHQDFDGKNCPHRTLSLGWTRFLNMVQAELDTLNKKTSSSSSTKKEEKKTTTSTLKYKVGDTVTIDAVYGSSTSKTKLVPSKKTGTITDIPNKKAPNPYLLNDGDIGWVNDKCIVKKASTVNTKKETTTKKDSSKLVLKNEPLYTTSSTKIVSRKITGTFYKWNNEVVNGRIRITNKKERIGKVGQVTGWIKKK